MSDRPTVPGVFALAMELGRDERLQLLHLLLDAHHAAVATSTPIKERIPGLHRGVFTMTDDFDEPIDGSNS